MQINRLFEIIYISLDKDIVTARELAERFEVSTRTIYRDVETLSASGIPIYMSKGKGGGISLLPGFVLNKTVLTTEEKEEIISSMHAVEAVQIDSTGAVLQKLKSLFGETDTDWISVDFGMWSDGEQEAALFEKLKQAIVKRKVACFNYVSAKGEATERETEPVQLLFKGMSWYLYAYCRERKDFRYFKLKRIRNLSVQEEIFCKRENLQKKPLSKESYAEGNSNSKMRFLHLKLQIQKEAAYRVYDEFDTYKQLEDGSYLVEMDFPDNEWLMQYILGYGSRCRVIEPIELKERVGIELEKMMNNNRI